MWEEMREHAWVDGKKTLNAAHQALVFCTVKWNFIIFLKSGQSYKNIFIQIYPAPLFQNFSFENQGVCHIRFQEGW
jgi:hypothetical protein